MNNNGNCEEIGTLAKPIFWWIDELDNKIPVTYIGEECNGEWIKPWC